MRGNEKVDVAAVVVVVFTNVVYLDFNGRNKTLSKQCFTAVIDDCKRK